MPTGVQIPLPAPKPLSTMNKFKQIVAILMLSFAWFLLLPFKFEIGWSLFGGYRLMKVYLPYSDGFQHEIDINHAAYSSHADVLIFVLLSLLLGYITYLLVKMASKSIK